MKNKYLELDATIVPARYSGAYEGGAWVAIMEGIDYSDLHGAGDTCVWWLSENRGHWGSGDTPNDALKDLYKNHTEWQKKAETEQFTPKNKPKKPDTPFTNPVDWKRDYVRRKRPDGTYEYLEGPEK